MTGGREVSKDLRDIVDLSASKALLDLLVLQERRVRWVLVDPGASLAVPGSEELSG